MNISIVQSYKSITDRTDASLKLYFRDVSKLSLITADKEIALAKKIAKGDNKALEELIKANLRFVISIAKQYQNKGLPLVDLIQEGNCGLAIAATKYNPTKGYRFISYAVWWIRQSILKALSDKSRTVRIPICNIATLSKINRMSNKFIQENGRPPSINEIHENTDLNYNKIVTSMSSNVRSVSLESPVKDEDSSNLIDIIPNTNSQSADLDTNKSDLAYQIEQIIKVLPDRESDVLRLLYGIGVEQKSGTDIANLFGIGSERVRQISHVAMNRIRKKYGKELINLL